MTEGNALNRSSQRNLSIHEVEDQYIFACINCHIFKIPLSEKYTQWYVIFMPKQLLTCIPQKKSSDG